MKIYIPFIPITAGVVLLLNLSAHSQETPTLPDSAPAAPAMANPPLKPVPARQQTSSAGIAAPAFPNTSVAATAPVFSERLSAIVRRAGGGPGPGKALLIQSSEPNAKEQSNLQEDLTVMSHILDRTLEERPGGPARGRTAMGIDLFFAPGAGSIRNLYLDGYGALFLLNVGFPLLAPPAKAETQKNETPVDSTWEEAKQELYGNARPEGGLPPGAVEEYSEENVSKLKNSLLEALKNATNIRGLKPNESVTMCVLGGASPGPGRINALPQRRTSGYGGRYTALIDGGNMAPFSGTTIMTIRAAKSDIDAFAKGNLDLDQFGKKVRITTYASDALGGGGGEVFIGGGGMGGGGGGFGGGR